MEHEAMSGEGIPKIHRLKTRKLIEEVAVKLAEMDGFKTSSRAFEWIAIEPYLRDTVNPRSSGYVIRAIEILKIVKKHGLN
jgi:hypothetical protein